MPIDPPYRENIVADLRAQIAAGDLKPGADIPSTTELAKHYGVHRNTARAAVDYLKATGELVGHQGLAVRVAQK